MLYFFMLFNFVVLLMSAFRTFVICWRFAIRWTVKFVVHLYTGIPQNWYLTNNHESTVSCTEDWELVWWLVTDYSNVGIDQITHCIVKTIESASNMICVIETNHS